MLLKAKKYVLENNSILILLILVVFSVFFVDSFTNGRSLTSTLHEISLYGMIAVGLSVVMMAGAIDLSIGYQAGLSAVITVGVINLTGNIWMGVIGALAAGLIMGMFNGFIVTVLNISPLIATIATNFIYKGLSFAMTNKESLRCDYSGLKSLYSFPIFGQRYLTPCVVVFILVLAAFGVFLRKTRTGVNIYVAGGNAEAGELAGIRTARIRFLAYALCGVCCAVSGIFMASRSNAAFYTQGAGRDIFAISACVIGGLKMAGGSGTMTKVLIGIVIMRLISTVMNLTAVPSSWVNFVSGMLLIVVLIIDRFTKAREK